MVVAVVVEVAGLAHGEEVVVVAGLGGGVEVRDGQDDAGAGAGGGSKCGWAPVGAWSRRTGRALTPALGADHLIRLAIVFQSSG